MIDKHEDQHRPIPSNSRRKKPQKATDSAKFLRKMKRCAHDKPCTCKISGGDGTWGHPILLYDDGVSPVARTPEDSPPGRTGPADKTTKEPSDDHLARAEYAACATGRSKFVLCPNDCPYRSATKGKTLCVGGERSKYEPACKRCHRDTRNRLYNRADRMERMESTDRTDRTDGTDGADRAGGAAAAAAPGGKGKKRARPYEDEEDVEDEDEEDSDS